MMVFRRKKKDVVVIGKVVSVKSPHPMMPPGMTLVSAIYAATGGFGFPIDFIPEKGAELRLRINIDDPRVPRVVSYVFSGSTTILRERAKTYTLAMPPTERVADAIVKALMTVMKTIARWGYATIIIAQSHPRYALRLFRVPTAVKYPWRDIKSVRVPHEVTLLKLTESVTYGDTKIVIDGKSGDDMELERIPTAKYEIGYAVYDKDITTVVYGFNPYGIRKLIELEKLTEIPITELMKKYPDLEREVP